MLKVGLTGGIGAGKSTVAGRLREHGAVIIDADVIAREVVKPGTEGLSQLMDAFGSKILDPNGCLNRAKLASQAFVDDEHRARLNAILHPLIAARTANLIAAVSDDAIVVHDVPLLVENKLGPQYHLVIVVSAPLKTRVHRLVQFRGMSEADAQNRIAAQATEEQRLLAADVWLDNGSSPDVVLTEVDRLWADRLIPFEANMRLNRPLPTRPAIIQHYDPVWPIQAERAMSRIRAAVGPQLLRIDHIGSTAVPELPAQDVLDLQVTVASLRDADVFSDRLRDAGFLRASGEWQDDPQDGSPTPWPKRFHYFADPARAINVHVRSTETPAWRLALLVRDWLREVALARDEYAAIKQELAARHSSERSVEGYAIEKQLWLNHAIQRAQEWGQRRNWRP